MIYLDHNATTPVDGRVAAVVEEHFRARFGNPSSGHRAGREAAEALELARRQVADLVGADAREVVFTSGGTEANNLALKGAVAALGLTRLIVSAVEHASVRAPARWLAGRGMTVETLPVDEQGRVCPADLEARLAEGPPALVSVMWVNNETGVVQDIPALAEVVRRHGSWLHTDAVQGAGRLPLAWTRLGAHLLSLSGHKLGAPKGSGALVVDRALDVEPLLHGGGQEDGRRAGTENVPAQAGFGLACALAQAELDDRRRHWAALRRHLEAGLEARLPGVVIHGRWAPRVANTCFFSVPGVDGEALLLALDERGFAVGSGAACGRGEPSHVLTAMGVEPALAYGALRVSLGVDNTREEIDRFLDALVQETERLRGLAAVAGR